MSTRFLYILIVLFLININTNNSFANIEKDIQFKKESRSTTISDSVIRGERNIYYFNANKGQFLNLNIKSIENNAVFQVYYNKNKTLKGTEEGKDAKVWQGYLPTKGRYKIVVGGTRGNATYNLNIAIGDIRPISSTEEKNLNNLLGKIEAKQSFLISLNQHSNVYFVSVINGINDYYFAIVKDNRILFQLNRPELSWSLYEIEAISFMDMNFDGFYDITVISSQMTGVGPTAAQNFPVAWIYLNDQKKGFTYYEDEKYSSLNTVSKVYQYMKRKYIH